MKKKGKKRVLLGIVGRPGAGKTTAARYLRDQGFTIVTLSDFIKQEVRKKKLPMTREVLQRYGNILRKTHGPQILAQRALQKINSDGVTHAVIDGIRNIYEVSYLENEPGFTLIGLTARVRIRYERVYARRGSKWAGTYAAFRKQEEREDSLGNREVGLRVKDCLKKASITIENNGTLDAFIQEIDRVIKRKRS